MIFMTYTGAWPESCILKDETVNRWFYGLDPRYRNLMLDITGKWQRGEELPEDSILQTLQHPKWWQILMHREVAGVAPAILFDQRNQGLIFP